MIVPLYARTFTFALGDLQFPLHRGCQTLESATWGKRASLSVLLDQPQSRGLTTSASAAYRFELPPRTRLPGYTCELNGIHPFTLGTLSGIQTPDSKRNPPSLSG